MRSARTHLVSRIAVGAIALALVPTTTSAAVAAPQEDSSARLGGRSVTLITGDRVVILDETSKTKAIIPGKGREKVAFSTYEHKGHMYVVPHDARSLVTQGRLDERLFDVTTLLEYSYDDKSRSTLPLIVSHVPGFAAPRIASARTTANLSAVNASAVTADKNGAAWQSLIGAGVKKVWLDGQHKANLDRSTVQIGAPVAWEAGYTGEGVKVAVLDSGVDQTHPDLATREIAEKNFSESADAVDRLGHGTHVASIVAGTGAKAGGKYQGVAHGASILDGKIFNDQNLATESAMIAAMQWAVDQGAKVVNMSVGGPDGPEVDPVEEAVNTLSAKHGTLFVISAGNRGNEGEETLSTPGTADAALTVGAVSNNDSLASFSSRGPRFGDGAIKPDITAPGVSIAAAKAAQGVVGTPFEDGYVLLSGTSMAAPHVAGAAAILAQQHPDWNGERIKATLTASAKTNSTLNVFQQGSGRLDVARAITQTVSSSPTNINFGTQLWPHDDDPLVSKPVTYHNSGTTDVTLDLTVNATGPDGSPAPAGLLTASPAKVTVPAGGEATVNAISNTKIGTLEGIYKGTLVATAGGTVVTTPVATNREPESYTLTLNHIGPDGAPGPGDAIIMGLGTDKRRRTITTSGSFRLPKDNYVVDSLGQDGDRKLWLVYPGLHLTQDTTITLDFRLAKQTKVTPLDPTAKLRAGDVRYKRRSGTKSFSSGFSFPDGQDLGTLWSAHLGPQLPPEEMKTQINTHWTNEEGDFFGLNYFHSGSLPTGFTRAPKLDDLARVHAKFGATAPGRFGVRMVEPHETKRDFFTTGSLTAPVSFDLPGERDEYYTTEDTVWEKGLWQVRPPFGIEEQLTSPLRTYQAGRKYEELHNRAVFGPVMPESRDLLYTTRTGNTISVDVRLWGDGGGNYGLSDIDSGFTRLSRDGNIIGERTIDGFGSFTVPADTGNYLLEAGGVRSGVSDVSTDVRGSWTFSSGPPNGTGKVMLPLSFVRFTPALDETNSAPAGKRFILPVSVQPQGSSSAVIPKSLTVDVSYDGGHTWTAAKVLGNMLAVVQHPANASTVSLRAKATDHSGNTVDQTIINAYKLK